METNKKDVKTSLCIALDNDTLKRAKLIQELRKKFDKTFDLWMPHLNILHPFIPESEFASNLPLITQALSQGAFQPLNERKFHSLLTLLVQPFDLTFDRFNFFYRKKGSIIYLAPSEQVSYISIFLFNISFFFFIKTCFFRY